MEISRKLCQEEIAKCGTKTNRKNQNTDQKKSPTAQYSIIIAGKKNWYLLEIAVIFRKSKKSRSEIEKITSQIFILVEIYYFYQFWGFSKLLLLTLSKF